MDTQEGPKITPPSVVLGHEFAHAKDYDSGTLDTTINPKTDTKRSEEKAVNVENKIRKEMHLPVRSRYK